MFASSEDRDFMDRLKEACSLLSGATHERRGAALADRYCTPGDADAAGRNSAKSVVDRKQVESLLGPGL